MDLDCLATLQTFAFSNYFILVKFPGHKYVHLIIHIKNYYPEPTNNNMLYNIFYGNLMEIIISILLNLLIQRPIIPVYSIVFNRERF